MDKLEFDFVIVGAGAAGCVLANRLSALPHGPSVCLIERGPAHTDSRWNVAMAAAISYNKAYENQRDLWLRYLSEPEKELNNRRIDCPRGVGWGGTTAVNGMVFVRGQPQDFDRWATHEYCSQLWSYEKCLPYFKRLESYTPGFDLEHAIDVEAEVGCMKTHSQYRGFDGPIKVSSGRYTNQNYSKCPYFPEFIRAGIQAGHKYNPDYNGIVQEGIGWMDANISGGLRQTSSRCYLLPAISRSNLIVISESVVCRVILEEKRAVGVEYIGSKGEKRIVNATKEVILSGGAYNSPQLLMLSGIGDPAELRKAGIEPLHELPGVGRNLMDHLHFPLMYATRHPEFSFAPGDWKTTNTWANRMRAQWECNRDGQGASNHIEACHFFKTNELQTTANMECALMSSKVDVYPDGNFYFNSGMSVLLINERPPSIGRLALRSKTPTDDPLIEQNYFSDPKEIREFVDAIHIVRKVFAQPALAEYIGEELLPGPNFPNIEQFIRMASTSCFHPCGTCRMGDPDAAPTPEVAHQLVVDAELRVCGLRGLRVVDASVMPSITSGNINAPTLMIAERAADFIASTIY